MSNKAAPFTDPLAALPPSIAAGRRDGGPFCAFFDDASPAGIAAYFAADTQGDTAPGPYFDPAYYKRHNPDWREAAHPLLHYLSEHLAGRARPAHPLFDAAEYAALYPDLLDAGAAHLLHFAQHGDAEGRSPGRGFDADFYRRAYLPLETRRPFADYIRYGRAAGRLPLPPVRPSGALEAALTEATEARARAADPWP